MQKTRMGISVGALGAVMYLSGLFGSYLIAMIVLAGYILLFEENEWLRKCAFKAVALAVFFTVLTNLVELIPDAINIIDNVFFIFGGTFNIALLTNLVNVITSVLGFIRTILFIGLGLRALNQGTIAVPVVDRMISKYMD